MVCMKSQSLWARRYFVSTIGIDEHLIRRYVRHQYHHNQTEQPSLFEKLISITTAVLPAIKPANTKPPALRPVVGYFIA